MTVLGFEPQPIRSRRKLAFNWATQLLQQLIASLHWDLMGSGSMKSQNSHLFYLFEGIQDTVRLDTVPIIFFIFIKLFLIFPRPPIPLRCWVRQWALRYWTWTTTSQHSPVHPSWFSHWQRPTPRQITLYLL